MVQRSNGAKRMAVIIRISEVGDQLTPTRLAGNYDNSQEATVALEDMLAGFESHGFNTEHGYHWARDHEGNQFRFVISGR
jgi:hypothetical protein